MKTKKGLIPFEPQQLSRHQYEKACERHSYEPKSDQACENVYMSYVLAKHGKARDLKLAYSRGWTIFNVEETADQLALAL